MVILMKVELKNLPYLSKSDGAICFVLDKRYRNSFDIIALILEKASNGASRCTLAKHLNTNYAYLNKQLNFLVRKNFLYEIEGTALYKTSDKGLEFLKLCRLLFEMLSKDSVECSTSNITFKHVHCTER